MLRTSENSVTPMLGETLYRAGPDGPGGAEGTAHIAGYEAEGSPLRQGEGLGRWTEATRRLRPKGNGSGAQPKTV